MLILLLLSAVLSAGFLIAANLSGVSWLIASVFLLNVTDAIGDEIGAAVCFVIRLLG